MSLIAVTIEEKGWNALGLAQIAERAARAALAAQALDPQRFEISLLACSDERIAALNDRFRGKAGPTNVLSWPAENLAPASPGAPPRPPASACKRIGKSPNGGARGDRVHLGDVAIALQTCAREARAQSISLKNHATHLILHGCLHLLGFDHGTEADAALMEGIETRALDGMTIEDPHAPAYTFADRDAGSRFARSRFTGEAWATTVRQRR